MLWMGFCEGSTQVRCLWRKGHASNGTETPDRFARPGYSSFPVETKRNTRPLNEGTLVRGKLILAAWKYARVAVSSANWFERKQLLGPELIVTAKESLMSLFTICSTGSVRDRQGYYRIRYFKEEVYLRYCVSLKMVFLSLSMHAYVIIYC